MRLEDVIAGDYVIDNDIVNVNGSVDISGRGLTKIPWQFGRVEGTFNCCNNELTSLRGCPTYVGYGFWCHKNRLKSLENCPETVGLDFFCYKNQLISLKYSPISIGGNFHCQHNRLISLRHCPIAANVVCYDNPIKTFAGVPFEIISKIDSIHKYFKKKITAIPQEYSGDFEVFMRNKKRNRSYRKISVEERLRNIV